MKIKLLIMDVDGTLTDGKIYMGSNGEVMKAFNAKDGYAILKIRDLGIEPVIITGRYSKIVENRAKEIGVVELHQGVTNKLETVKEIISKYQITADNVAFIGDDVNDTECIKYCGVSACPNDAVEELYNLVDLHCHHDGGNGAIREFINYLKHK